MSVIPFDDGAVSPTVHKFEEQLIAIREMRHRLVAILETTADPAQLPSLFADIASLEEWIARLEGESAKGANISNG